MIASNGMDKVQIGDEVRPVFADGNITVTSVIGQEIAGYLEGEEDRLILTQRNLCIFISRPRVIEEVVTEDSELHTKIERLIIHLEVELETPGKGDFDTGFDACVEDVLDKLRRIIS